MRLALVGDELARCSSTRRTWVRRVEPDRRGRRHAAWDQQYILLLRDATARCARHLLTVHIKDDSRKDVAAASAWALIMLMSWLAAVVLAEAIGAAPYHAHATAR